MPIVSYLRNGTLPKDPNASRRLKVQSSCFILIRDVLYKKGFSCPYLRCLAPVKANYVMREFHEEVCGNHSRALSLGSQIDTSKILLAYNEEGHPVQHEGVQQVPTPQQHHMITIGGTYTNERPLAVHLVRVRHSRTLPYAIQ